MRGIEVKPDIFWVGAIDWAVRDFHGYKTPRGTTYNNYLIMDEDITLVDTVKYDFADVAVASVSGLVDPKRIRNIVINHVENDHVTSLDRFMALAPGATVYITERGKQVIEKLFDTSGWNIKVVKTGDELRCGRYRLRFIETPMLHWPDSMMTYVEGAGLLISQDVFGQHLATAERFDDEFIRCASNSELEHAVVDYYANILMPFGKLIKLKLKELREMGINIDTIAPDHGVIWRRQPGRVLEMYDELAGGAARLGVAVVYDTMWQSTERMVKPIVEGVLEEGVDCEVFKLRATAKSIAVTEMFKLRGCLVGSPTLNNEVFPSVAQFVTYLKGLRPADRMMGAFGSFGWGGGAVRWLYQQFGEMKLEAFSPGVEVKNRPATEDLERCHQFGREFARRLREYQSNYE